MPQSLPLRASEMLGPGLGPNVPRSLKAVVLLYLFVGLVGLALTVYSVIRREWTVSPLVAAIPIGIGLARLREGWRVCAILTAGIVFIVAMLSVVTLLSGVAAAFESLAAEFRPFFFVLQIALAVLAGLASWTILILTGPLAKAYFPASTLQYIAGGLRCLLIIVILICVARLTGGLGGSLNSLDYKTVSSSSPGGTSNGDYEVSFPLTIEVHGYNGPSYWSLAWRQESKGMFSQSTSTRMATFRVLSLGWTPEPMAKELNKILVSIELKSMSGPYWMPIFKRGKASIELLIRGTGRYEALEFSTSVDTTFQVTGLCTTEDLQEKLSSIGERRAISEIVDKLQNPGTRGNLALLERLWHVRPMQTREMQALVAAAEELGDAYAKSGDYPDARRAYRQGILAAECFLLQLNNAFPLLAKTKLDDAWMVPLASVTVAADLAKLHNHVAWRLATDPRPGSRNGNEAVTHATKACQLSDRKSAYCLGTLAAAYAEAGDFEKAIECQKESIDLDPNIRGAKERLAAFEGRRAYRQPRVPLDFKNLAKDSAWFMGWEHPSDATRLRVGEAILLGAYRKMKVSPDRDTVENRPYFLKSIERLAQFNADFGRSDESMKWRRIADFYQNEASHEKER